MKIIRRKDAKAQGLKRYFSGKPCPAGHVAERQVGTGHCLVCNLARVKAAYDPVKKRAYRLQWYVEHRDESLAKSRAYHEANKERRSAERKARRPAIRAWERSYSAMRRQSDLSYRIEKALRARVYSALKRKTKTGSAVRDLGCSVAELVAHLEASFAPDMSWDNWTVVWQIDHIKPLASFDLTDRAQFIEAAHFSNLQPLRIEDHQAKSAGEKGLRARL